MYIKFLSKNYTTVTSNINFAVKKLIKVTTEIIHINELRKYNIKKTLFMRQVELINLRKYIRLQLSFIEFVKTLTTFLTALKCDQF